MVISNLVVVSRYCFKCISSGAVRERTGGDLCVFVINFFAVVSQVCARAPVCVGSLLVRAPDSWSKGWEVESRQKRRENLLLQSQLCVLTLVRCPFHPCVTAVARKRSRSFCPKCRWQVTPKHAYTLDRTKSEWADYASVHAQCRNLSENELTRDPVSYTHLTLPTS